MVGQPRTRDKELERTYLIAKMTPEQAVRFFRFTSESEAQQRLHELKALPCLMDHERVELCAHAERLGEAVAIERLRLVAGGNVQWESMETNT
jgi:hypothetical protein